MREKNRRFIVRLSGWDLKVGLYYKRGCWHSFQTDRGFCLGQVAAGVLAEIEELDPGHRGSLLGLGLGRDWRRS
jgi:hypothetical protein